MQFITSEQLGDWGSGGGETCSKNTSKKRHDLSKKGNQSGIIWSGGGGKHSKFKTKSKKVKINGNKPVTSKYKWI